MRPGRSRARCGWPRGAGLGVPDPGDAQLRELGRDSGGWRVTVIPRELAAALPSPTMPESQPRRLQTLLEVPEAAFAEIEGEHYLFALALRAVSPDEKKRAVLAMLEICSGCSSRSKPDLGHQ